MKLIELTLLEIDYLRPYMNGHRVYLSGQLMHGKPVHMWKKFEENGKIIEGAFEEITNIVIDNEGEKYECT